VISVQSLDLIPGTRSISGSLTVSSIKNEDNLRFSETRGIRPMIEATRLPDPPVT
jgi:propanol-preferring alcohol dehydrogenase